VKSHVVAMEVMETLSEPCPMQQTSKT